MQLDPGRWLWVVDGAGGRVRFESVVDYPVMGAKLSIEVRRETARVEELKLELDLMRGSACTAPLASPLTTGPEGPPPPSREICAKLPRFGNPSVGDSNSTNEESGEEADSDTAGDDGDGEEEPSA